MKTTYENIIDVNRIASFESKESITDILTLARGENIPHASKDRQRALLLAIDVQNDFMQNIGSLPVAGSKGDVQRLTRWMYCNLESLTHVICSLDCHSMMQIFHPVWWLDQEGKHPKPFTIISYEDVASGIWVAANGESERSLEYLRNLESAGNKQLCIWPYHCLEGTFGAKLESEFTKMLYFHAAARNATPKLIYKGQNPYTEMYGIIKAEYDKEHYINYAVLDAIQNCDAIFIAGEASSHCVLASVEQILEYYAADRSVTSRITLLEDCMSPIIGFEDSTRQRFEELRDRHGIQIRKSTEVIL
ncbi:cysteine hydrolase family protein [Sphingobacterium haloxyli]|uniref:Nicotinamidase n=1 Tax=Sphingobacterium haloxyli TaxID=2100533 RepID=A0A2S9J0K1_9SPHI|nr:hypothetical protein [Sphingobacterium haloxyli]PRD46301.1 hypothetical protein C5745_16080 [Sphingobacterium haloxyli]